MKTILWFMLAWANAFIAVRSFELGYSATVSSYTITASLISVIGAWIAHSK